MDSQSHSLGLVPFTAEPHSEFSSSTDVPEQISITWSEDSSSPAASHKMPWEQPLFSLENHLKQSPSASATSQRAARAGPDQAPTEYEASPPSAGFEGTPSFAGSFSSVESDAAPANSKATKNARTVSSLTPEQLERKRRNDRRAQRAIRERTKRRMEEYQGVLAQKEEMIMALSRRVSVLEAELATYRGQQQGGAVDGEKHPLRDIVELARLTAAL
ncbi:hypothetical protein VUR80DRAFT_4340 [Thermomyces stellatus]